MRSQWLSIWQITHSSRFSLFFFEFKWWAWSILIVFGIPIFSLEAWRIQFDLNIAPFLNFRLLTILFFRFFNVFKIGFYIFIRTQSFWVSITLFLFNFSSIFWIFRFILVDPINKLVHILFIYNLCVCLSIFMRLNYCTFFLLWLFKLYLFVFSFILMVLIFAQSQFIFWYFLFFLLFLIEEFKVRVDTFRWIQYHSWHFILGALLYFARILFLFLLSFWFLLI